MDFIIKLPKSKNPIMGVFYDSIIIGNEQIDEMFSFHILQKNF